MTRANSCGPAWLDQKLDHGDTIVIDGAMGTELQARGVTMHDKVWSATAALTNPDEVRATHVDYIRAGAEVIIANTFSAGRHMLEPAGLGDDVERVNRRSVELAHEARDQAADSPTAVAGSICEWFPSDSGWSDARLRDSFTEQAELLAEGRVDLITIEMGEHPVHTPLAVQAALTTGLPVWAGLSCQRDDNGPQLVGFDPPHYPLEDIIEAVLDLGIGLISVMHSPIADTGDAIAMVRERWQGPLGVYPESGYFTMPNWQFEDIISPADLVTETGGWIARGAQVIGGCCGLGTAHIAALKQAFGQREPVA